MRSTGWFTRRRQIGADAARADPSQAQPASARFRRAPRRRAFEAHARPVPSETARNGPVCTSHSASRSRRGDDRHIMESGRAGLVNDFGETCPRGRAKLAGRVELTRDVSRSAVTTDETSAASLPTIASLSDSASGPCTTVSGVAPRPTSALADEPERRIASSLARQPSKSISVVSAPLYPGVPSLPECPVSQPLDRNPLASPPETPSGCDAACPLPHRSSPTRPPTSNYRR